MAEIRPIDIQKHLDGIEFPASKQDIIEQARASGVDETIVSRLEFISDREYETPDEVTKELGAGI
jgi:hypothetical protein